MIQHTVASVISDVPLAASPYRLVFRPSCVCLAYEDEFDIELRSYLTKRKVCSLVGMSMRAQRIVSCVKEGTASAERSGRQRR
jgi:hypothetical protein